MTLQNWDFYFCLLFILTKATEGQQIDTNLTVKIGEKKKIPNPPTIIIFPLKLHLGSRVTLHKKLCFRNEEITLTKEGKADKTLILRAIKHLPPGHTKLCNKAFPKSVDSHTHRHLLIM